MKHVDLLAEPQNWKPEEHGKYKNELTTKDLSFQKGSIFFVHDSAQKRISCQTR